MNPITTFFCDDNTKLFGSSASAEKTLAYYKDQIRGQGCADHIELKYLGEPRGKALFATKDFEKGQRIFTELAAFAFQSTENTHIARVCSRCLHFVGSPQDQIELLMQRKLTAKEALDVTAAINQLPSDWKNGFSGDATVTCGCGEVYCGLGCKEKDIAFGHLQVCTAANPAAAHAINEFKDHAKGTNETFLLALKVFAFIADKVKSHKTPSSREALEEAVWPIRVFAKDFWWNVCMPDEAEEEDPEELKRALKGLLKDSVELLKDVFKHVPELNPVMNVDFYGLLMGIFERNNVAIVTPSPMLALLEHLPSPITESVLERVSQFISSSSNSHSHDHGHEGGSHDHSHGGNNSATADPFEALDALVAEGSGLHTIHATINHSCTPNAMVFKDAAGLDVSASSSSLGSISGNVIRDGRTVIRAIKNIKKGEEITISYLDEGSDEMDADFEVADEDGEDEREWRAMSLREYGIDKCECAKCKK
ncbi:SET domain-containing protein [Rhizoclosmatium globosum]|uniref:SET domain-containing protein n=1 Tax=Rhizoclosmatium globosum TaxID=329046 RepID=A0A1Y2C060_9FUNG|nr:SET domain-containing protein [Rhizoclosmatium globosum]|eukprot:ORY40401.1 SET domain-containing protein [Rhizoclosmatium globosum]